MSRPAAASDPSSLRPSSSPASDRAARAWLAPSSAPLAPIAVAFALGVALDRLTAPALGLWLAGAVLALITWLALWCARRSRLSAACLLVAGAALGGARHHQTWFVQRADDVSRCATRLPTPAMLEVVSLESIRRFAPQSSGAARFKDGDDFAQCDMRVERIRDRDVWTPASGVVRVGVVGTLPEVRAGDRLRIMGKLALPAPATNPGEFDHAARLRAQGITAVMSCEGKGSFVLLDEPRRYDAVALLDDLRSSAKQALVDHLAPDVAGMGQALLLGGYEAASRPQIERFVQTGSIHVLAISGMHVAILAGLLFFGVSRGLVPRRLGLLGIGLLTLAYCTLVGGETPVVRATVLVLLACGASWLWQRRASWNALFAAALVAVAWRPADLFSMGPQLSFLAAGVLIALDVRFSRRPPDDPLDRLLEEAQPWWKKSAKEAGLRVGELFLVSLLVWGATTPLVLWNYHLISPIAVALNLLLGPISTLALFFGFCVLGFAGWFPAAAGACGWVASGSLRLMDGIVAGVHDWPGSYCWTPAPALWWVVGFYLGLAVYLELRSTPWLRRWQWPLLLAYTALGFVSASSPRPADRLTCTFLDVGHGLAVIVELPDGRALLYDAGQLGSPDRAARAVASALWSQGRDRVHAAIVSHADSDHFNGLPLLLRQFDVDVVYLAPSFTRREGGSTRSLFNALTKARTPTRPLVAGDGVTTADGATIRVLQPSAEGVPGEDNANSLVVAIEYAGRRILLTGDLEEAGLAQLLRSPPLACDVLLAPHHGSANSLPDSLSAWASPAYVVASGDPAKTSGYIRERYRENGSQVLTTGEVGAVRVTITAKGLTVETYGAAGEANVDDLASRDAAQSE